MASIEPYRTSTGAILYRVRHRTPEGRQTSRRGFTTKRAAQQYIHQVEADKARGQYVAPLLGKVMVGQLGAAWLDRQQGHIKPTTYRSYENAWRVHVAPTWGRAHISDIRYSHVQAWISQLSARTGPATVVMAHSVLARILDDAVKDRMMASNPARGVKLPKRPPRRNVYLTADQLDKLADESGLYRSLIFLLGVGGLRWGEAAALRVCDVDFLRRSVELHRNAVYVGPGMAVGSLKSNKSRTVVFAPVRDGRTGPHRRGQGPGGAAVAFSGRRLSGGAVIGEFMAGWCGAPLPEGRPHLPQDHGPCPKAHSRIPCDQLRCESQGGAADARPRQCGHDAGCVRRAFRLRSGLRGRECGQNVATAGWRGDLLAPETTSGQGISG